MLMRKKIETGSKTGKSSMLENLAEFFSPFLIMAMILMPMQVNLAVAQDDSKKVATTTKKVRDEKVFTDQSMKDVMGVLNTGLQVYQDLNMKQKMQSNIMLRQMQIEKTTEDVEFPDKIFPQCKLAPARSARISNMCDPNMPLSGGDEVNALLLYIKRAEEIQAKYEVMSMTGLEGSRCNDLICGKGINCIMKQKLELDNKLDEEEEKMRAMIDQIKDENKLFTKRQDDLLAEMGNLQSELDGTKHPRANESLKLKDSEALSKSLGCNSVIANPKDEKMRGFRQFELSIDTSGQRTKAQGLSTLAGKRNLKNDIKKEIKKITRYMKNNRMTADEATKLTTSTGKVAGIGVALNESFNDYEQSRKDLTRELTEELSGYGSVPDLSKKSNSQVKKYVQTAKRNWKRSVINECMEDNQESMKITEMIASIKQEGIKGGSGAIGCFQSKLTGLYRMLYDEAIDMDTFQEKVDTLNNSIGRGMYVGKKLEWRGRKASHHWSVAELVGETYKHCKTRYEQVKSSGSSSAKDAIDNAFTKLKEYHKLNENYAEKLEGELLSRVMNCKGINFDKAAVGSCDVNKMNPSHGDFCYEQATDCAKTINKCYANVKKEIKIREEKVQHLARVHKRKVAQYKAAQDIHLKSIAGQFAERSNYWKNRIPGITSSGNKSNVAFDQPKDLFIALGKDTFKDFEDVALTDTKDYAKHLVTKLEEYETKLKNQRTSILAAVDANVKDIQSKYTAEVVYWKGEAKLCGSSVNAYNSSINKNDSETMKAQGEEEKLFNETCYALSQTIDKQGNPICPKVQELQDIGKIVHRLNSSDRQLLAEMEQTCAYNTEDSGNQAMLERISDYCNVNPTQDQCTEYFEFIKSPKKDPDCKAFAASDPDKRITCEFHDEDALPKVVRRLYAGLWKQAKTWNPNQNDTNTGERRITSCPGNYGGGRNDPTNILADINDALKATDFGAISI